MRRFLLATLVVALAIQPRRVAADLEGAEYVSQRWHVRLTAPKNWQASEQTSYPNVLLWLSRRAPAGKILLSAEQLSHPMTALEYAQETAALLASKEMGFRVRTPQLHSATGAYWIDFESRTAFLREAFLVSDGIGYALTLSAADARTRSQHLRAFDLALRSLRIVKTEAVGDAAGSAPDAGPSEQPVVPERSIP